MLFHFKGHRFYNAKCAALSHIKQKPVMRWSSDDTAEGNSICLCSVPNALPVAVMCARHRLLVGEKKREKEKIDSGEVDTDAAEGLR